MDQLLSAVRRTARGRGAAVYEDLDEHGPESLPTAATIPRELDDNYDNNLATADEIEMTSVSVVPDDTFTVTQAVNAFGFGKFQVKLSLFTGLCWMADSMEMTILSILSPALHCDWHISRYQQVLTTTIVFLGMMLSSTFWGNLSDRYGRKPVYPTPLRAVGVGTCSAMARLGAMVTPYVAQVLMQSSITLATAVYGLAAVLAAVACFFLPIETKDREMSEVLGALISAHLLMMDPDKPFGDLRPSWYDGELLQLAHDLASRLLPAFEESSTGIPYPRVNLRQGLPYPSVAETCPAGAGSLVLEFGLLSRLLDDPVYEGYARRANKVLWNLREKSTGLLVPVGSLSSEQLYCFSVKNGTLRIWSVNVI